MLVDRSALEVFEVTLVIGMSLLNMILQTSGSVMTTTILQTIKPIRVTGGTCATSM